MGKVRVGLYFDEGNPEHAAAIRLIQSAGKRGISNAIARVINEHERIMRSGLNRGESVYNTPSSPPGITEERVRHIVGEMLGIRPEVVQGVDDRRGHGDDAPSSGADTGMYDSLLSGLDGLSGDV